MSMYNPYLGCLIFLYLLGCLNLALGIYISLQTSLHRIKVGYLIIGFLTVVFSYWGTQQISDFTTGSEWGKIPFIRSDYLSFFLVIPLIYAAVLVVEYFLFARVQILKKATIGNNSIKETLDKIPVGLAYYDWIGRPLLVNKKMNELHHDLFGDNLLNVKKSEERLIHRDLSSEVKILRETPDYILQIEDRIWCLKRRDLGDIGEALAYDITEEYELTSKIEEKNAILSEINHRLKNYNRNVNEYTRRKEILQTKTWVHNEIGESLVAFKNYLNGVTHDREGLIKIWRASAVLFQGQIEEEHSSWDDLLEAAASVGIRIKYQGLWPASQQNQNILLSAVHEAVNNTVRHAKGSEVYVSVWNEGFLKIKISNDGIQPEEDIVERGGLANIRQAVEYAGGSFRVMIKPQFSILILLPGEAEHD